MSKLLTHTKALFALFENENKLLDAIKELQENQVPVKDVLSPYPIKIREDVLTVKKAFIGKWAFICGLLGLILAILLQVYIHKNYILEIGDKPVLPIFSFIPATHLGNVK